jgi:uncharacterized protein YdcH (DUF465 family)
MQARLEKLKLSHKSLDKKVLKLYNSYTTNEELYKLKTMKLFIKDEIYRIEKLLEDQHGKGL